LPAGTTTYRLQYPAPTHHPTDLFHSPPPMGVTEELGDGVAAVGTQARDGKKFVSEVQNFMKKRREIEQEYAKKLNSLVKSFKVNDAGTLDQSWTVVKNETDAIANAHNALAERLGTEVEQVQKTWLTETAKNRKKLKKSGKKLLSELQAAQSGVEKAKSKFEGSRKKQDAVQAEANADPNPKNQKKLQGEVKNAEKADDEYKKAVEKLKSMESRFYDLEMPQILKDLQSMEEGRISMMKSSLQAFVAAQATIQPVIKSSCETMNSSVSNVNTESDIRLFISSNKTGRTPPPRTEYEPFDSALGACKPSPTPSGSFASFAPAVNTTSPSSTPAASYTPPAMKFNPTPTAAPAAPAAKSAQSDIWVKAIYTYSTAEPNELSFSEGDVIKVTYQDDSGWWEGELNGRVGVFPSNHVVYLEDTGAQSFDKCKAMYDYKAEDADELSIFTGDVLTIEDEDDEGWYYGRNAAGLYGKFPSNYVELLQ